MAGLDPGEVYASFSLRRPGLRYSSPCGDQSVGYGRLAAKRAWFGRPTAPMTPL